MKINILNSIFKNFNLSKIDKDYTKFNKNIFKKKNNNKKIILFELNWRESDIIASSFLLDRLSKNYNADIVSFSPNLIETFYLKIKNIFFKILNFKIFKINESIGVDKYIFPSLDKIQKEYSSKLLKKYKNKIKNKNDLLNLKFKNIKFGELLYDYHLRKYNTPSADLNSNEIFEDLNYFIKLLVFWDNYIKKNKKKLCALLIGHSCYQHGILLRLCLSNKIKTYEATTEYIFSHNKNNYYSFKDWDHSYKELKNINFSKRKKLINIGKKILRERFKGKNTRKHTFMIWSKKYSTYGKSKNNKIFNKTNNKRLIVFAHCFYDNPHVFGRNFFDDFYEWINFIGQKSNEIKNIDWYIKKHPGGQPGNDEIFSEFSKKYPRLNILPKNILNTQLIKEGIDYATTVYGNAGYELAYHNIPVIYASKNNPTTNYKFNFQVKNLKQYDYYISNPHRMQIDPNKKKISEYFVSKFMMQDYNIFFTEKENDKIDKFFSVDENLMTNIGFKNFMDNFNQNKHKIINLKIDKFIKSNKFRLDKPYEEITKKI